MSTGLCTKCGEHTSIIESCCGASVFSEGHYYTFEEQQKTHEMIVEQQRKIMGYEETDPLIIDLFADAFGIPRKTFRRRMGV
jgi:hypothetical protein